MNCPAETENTFLEPQEIAGGLQGSRIKNASQLSQEQLQIVKDTPSLKLLVDFGVWFRRWIFSWIFSLGKQTERIHRRIHQIHGFHSTKRSQSSSYTAHARCGLKKKAGRHLQPVTESPCALEHLVLITRQSMHGFQGNFLIRIHSGKFLP